MDNINQLDNRNLHLKQAMKSMSRNTSNLSKIPMHREVSPTLPQWIDKMFYQFCIVYETLWIKKFISEESENSLKFVYFKALSRYSENLIDLAVDEAIRMSKFPPQPADLVAICEANREMRATSALMIEQKPKQYKRSSKEIVNHYMLEIKSRLGVVNTEKTQSYQGT